MQQYVAYHGDLFSFWKLDWHHIYVHIYPFMKATMGGRRQSDSFDSLRTFECVVIQLQSPTGTWTGRRLRQCQRQEPQKKKCLENPVIVWGGWEDCEHSYVQNLKLTRISFNVSSNYIILLSKWGVIYCCTSGSVLADKEKTKQKTEESVLQPLAVVCRGQIK